jgi:hypothetical protein
MTGRTTNDRINKSVIMLDDRINIMVLIIADIQDYSVMRVAVNV